MIQLNYFKKLINEILMEKDLGKQKKKFFGNNINDLLKLNGWDTQVSTFSTMLNHFIQNPIKKYKIKKDIKF